MLLTSDAPVRHIKRTTSSMDDARTWLKNGASHMSCVLAEEQTAGRGRRGRVWTTFPYTSIAMSVVLKDTGPQPTLPLVVSLAVQDAIKEATGYTPCIKWPNDILAASGKKIGGILIEQLGKDGKISYIAGIGLNVYTPKEGIPADFPGTTLEHEQAPLSETAREEILNHLLKNISQYIDLLKDSGWTHFAKSYTQACVTLGRRVIWHRPDGTRLEGIAQKLDAAGALILKTEQGAETIHAGDVILQGKHDNKGPSC